MSRKIYRCSFLVILFLFMLGLSVLAAGITYFKGHENGRVEGFDKTDLEIFRAQPLEPRFYTEVWFHEMQFPDEDIIVIVNFQTHNLGWSRGYIDTYITYSDPTSGLLVDNIQVGPEDVKIDETGFGISAGDKRIELEGDHYRIRWHGEKIQADLTYKILVPSFQQGDGTMRFEGTDDFVKYNFPIPWAEVEGKITIEGKTHELKGWGSMNHDWQVLSPTRFMSDWRALWLYTDDATVSVVRCTAEDFKGEWVQRLMVAERRKVLFSSHDYTFEELDFKPVPGSNVPCPSRFRLEAVHGDDRIKGEIRVTGIQEKKEILGEFPSFFRQMAKLFVDETWSYRFWVDYNFEFHQEGKTRRINGRGTGNYVSSVKKK